MTSNDPKPKISEEELTELKQKIKSKQIKFGVIGLGYVGLPLAHEFAAIGVDVLGFDVSDDKVNNVNKGISYIKDIQDDELQSVVEKGKLKATTNMSLLSTVDVISICVPTPLRKTKDPDMSYIFSAIESVKAQLRKNHIIILESTTFPGTTEDVILPKLEETGLKVGADFFLAFSPERVDPGNKTYKTHNTPKVLGGVTPTCTELCENVYSLVIQSLVLVSSSRSAELVKLYENTFRSVNIGLANEMVTICDKLDIDVWEVIDAAATKPFGFMPFYPGPGLGGHCIPIDPFYLSWKLKTLDYDARFISLADTINSSMPQYVVNKTMDALNTKKRSVNGASILILGIAYKPNINDMRESPAMSIINLLESKGAKIMFHDNLNPSYTTAAGEIKTSVPLDESTLQEIDCAVIVTNHDDMDIDAIVKHCSLVVDTRNATRGYNNPHIFKL